MYFNITPTTFDWMQRITDFEIEMAILFAPPPYCAMSLLIDDINPTPYQQWQKDTHGDILPERNNIFTQSQDENFENEKF